MAETYRLKYNGLTASLGGSLTNVATSVTFSAALQSMGSNIPTLGTDEYLPLAIENEIVHLTAYASGATTGTISRGNAGTAGAAHASGVAVIHGPMVSDVGVGLVTSVPLLTGATYTSGDWTTVGGTVASDGTNFTLASGTATRAVRKLAEADVRASEWAVADCEILIPASGFVSAGGTLQLGLAMATSAAGSGGIAAQFTSSQTVAIEQDNTVAGTTVAYTSVAGAWQRLTLSVHVPSGYAVVFVNGIFVLRYPVPAGIMGCEVPGMKVYGVGTSFRNFSASRSPAPRV